MQSSVTVKDLMDLNWDRNAAVIVENFLNDFGGAAIGTIGSSAVKPNRFVNANASTGLLEQAPSSGNMLGVADDGGMEGESITVRLSGKAELLPSMDLAINDQIVAVAGGYGAPYREEVFGMASALAGADAQDDIDQSLLPSAVEVVCGGDETGNTVVVWGLVGGAITKETITLGTAATYTGALTFTAIYVLQTTAASTGTIDIQDVESSSSLISQISGSTAARYYGAIVPDDDTDAKGLEPQVRAGGANASDVLVIGTDYAGVEQKEVVTMGGTVYSDCVSAYRTVTYVGIGADGIAWDAGVTSQYTMQAPDTVGRTVRARALEANSTAGSTSEVAVLGGTTWVADGYTSDSGVVETWKAAAADIAKWRFVDLNTSALLAVAPSSGGKILGVSDEDITLSTFGRVKLSGRSSVYPVASVSAFDELVAVTGGLAAPMLTADAGLMSAVAGADASDDIDQTNLPDTVAAICGDDETSNTLIIRGKVGTTYTEETLPLVDTATATSTNTWAAIYSLETTAESVGTIDIKDGTETGLLIPQITGTTAARHYGAILTDDADDAKGLEVVLNAGGANTSEVVVIGTDYLTAAQKEIVTLTGAVPVAAANPYRTVTTLLIGADGIAFDAGVTSQYDINAPNTLGRAVRGVAETDQAVAGQPVAIMLSPSAVGKPEGVATVVFSKLFTTAGGAASESFTCPGVLATDSIQATVNAKGSTPRTIVDAGYASANTVDIEFSGDPSTDHQVSITVIRA
jgi:hypothetical protein